MQVERIYAQHCANGGNCLVVHVSSIHDEGATVYDSTFHVMFPGFPLWLVRTFAKINARKGKGVFVKDKDWHEQT